MRSGGAGTVTVCSNNVAGPARRTYYIYIYIAHVPVLKVRPESCGPIKVLEERRPQHFEPLQKLVFRGRQAKNLRNGHDFSRLSIWMNTSF